jgi:hypothetical protein
MCREFAEVGGLLLYGTSVTDLFRRAALYVDISEMREARRPSCRAIAKVRRYSRGSDCLR